MSQGNWGDFIWFKQEIQWFPQQWPNFLFVRSGDSEYLQALERVPQLLHKGTGGWDSVTLLCYCHVQMDNALTCFNTTLNFIHMGV